MLLLVCAGAVKAGEIDEARSPKPLEGLLSDWDIVDRKGVWFAACAGTALKKFPILALVADACPGKPAG